MMHFVVIVDHDLSNMFTMQVQSSNIQQAPFQFISCPV